MSPTEGAAKARERLRAAIDVACVARGEGQWTNGYRAARRSCGAESEAEDECLYQKEQAQWKFCGVAEKRVDRAMAAYVRAIRAETRRRR